MKNVIFTIVSILFISVLNAQDYSRVKINTDQEGLKRLSELGLAVDHGTHKPGYFFISDFSKEEIATMRTEGFTIEILIADVKKHYAEQNKFDAISVKNETCPPNSAGGGGFDPIVPTNFNLGSYAGFLTYQEMLDNLDAMHALYPNLINQRSAIDTFHTINDSVIYWVRMSDNPNIDENNEKEVMYSAVHHAREPNSMSATIFYMWYLLENYAGSEEIQHLLNNTEMYFVPCLNPDGYIYNELTDPNGGGMHRKNRRNVGTSNKGVDLNRNYSYGWGTTGISFDPNNDTYPGTGAFSEAETQAMRWFCENHDFKLAFNAHTYGDLVLFPIGTTSNEFAIHHNYFDRFTGYMVQYNGYNNMKSSGLYPASGDSDDYMYNDDLSNKPRIFAMTPEIGGTGGFWPASSQIIPNSKNMVFPNLMLAHIAHTYLIVEDQDPERLATATGNFNHLSERIGMDTGNVIVQIQPLQNIVTIGGPLNYDLAQITPQTGTFAYTLSPGIAINDTIIYVLETVYPTWTHRDTLVKLFGTYPVFIFDDASTAGQWNGPWTTETHTTYSASKAYSDSESGSNPANYANNSSRIFEYATPIDLTNANYADVSFFAKWEIEADYDYCQFQVSIDNGNSWIGQCGLYTVAGTSANGSVQPNGKPIWEGTKNWVREEISLSDYLGETIKVRFILEADGGVRQDGFYFDDFTVHKGTSGAGLDENQLYFTLYPNPSQGDFVISSSENLLGSSYQLMDAKGKVVSSELISNIASEYIVKTDELANGIYTLVLQSANGQTAPPKKLVLMK
ncbi:MAG: M14 family zinc carboxypeptidase [Crocinitomicaceae bacterium]|nr:M14 family zinc carboxypeptidase [Crocinitomicaceae bacterium]